MSEQKITKEAGFIDNAHDPLKYLMQGVSGGSTAGESKASGSAGVDIVTRIIADAKKNCSVKRVVLLDITTAKGIEEYNKIHNDKCYDIITKSGKFTVVETKGEDGFSTKDESYKYMIEYIEIDPEAVTKYFDGIIAAGVMTRAMVLGTVAREFPAVIGKAPAWISKVEKDIKEADALAKKNGKKTTRAFSKGKDDTEEQVEGILSTKPIIYQDSDPESED
jgi:hypothetical protein